MSLSNPCALKQFNLSTCLLFTSHIVIDLRIFAYVIESAGTGAVFHKNE